MDRKKDTMELTILTTSDIHGYLTADSYVDQTEKTAYGYTRAVSVINEIRKNTAGEVLYIENGDMLQGSPLATYLQKFEETPQKIIETLNAIAPDASIVGNHEFNFGVDYLDKAIAAAEYPFLCANILRNGQPAFGQPYLIKQYGDIRVGVLGVTTQYVPNWEKPEIVEGLEFVSALAAVQKYVPILKADEQCDAIIVAYHGGYERSLTTNEPTERLTGENEGSAILNAGLPIDALITGHQHRKEAAVVNGIPTVQTGTRGESIGKIVLDIQKDDENSVKSYELIDTTGVEEDLGTKAMLDELISLVQKWLDQPVGKSDGQLLLGDTFKAQKETHPYINLLNKIQMEAMGTDISAIAIFNDEVQGFNKTITMRDIINNYPFANTLANVKLTGKELKDILEHNSNYFALGETGELIVNPSYLYPKKELYNYDMFTGIDYTMDISKPVGERIVSLSKDGQDMMNSDEYFIVTVNNYRAIGGGNYPHYASDKVLENDPREVQDILINYIVEEANLTSDASVNYRAKI